MVPSPAFKSARLWPHLLVFAPGLYLFQAFHFGPTWSMRVLLGVTVVWWSLVLLLDRPLRRDLHKAMPALSPGRVLLAAAVAPSLALALWMPAPLAPSQAVLAAWGAVAGLLLRRPFFGIMRRHRPVHHLDRCLLLLAVGLFLISPYATPRLVGSGDAQHYARQLADFVEQLRQGEFPIFVGQSRFAFGGDIHPLRLAPYFQYAGGALDILTGRSLDAIALQNLLIVLSFLAALAGSYASLLAIAGRDRHWACVWLAVLFASSPGVLALLYSGDMIASWMTLPWLPLLFHGWVRAWRDPDDSTGLVLQAAALALMWLAHAPIALWASILTVLSETVRWAMRPAGWRGASRRLGAAALGGLLCHYVFVSVATLRVPDNPYLAYAMTHGLVMDILREGWTGFLRTVTGHPDHLLQDLHLSPGLWLAAIMGALALGTKASRRIGVIMLLALALCTVLLVPIQGVTDRFWNNLPGFVLTVTEKWPMQRFYPIMSALAVTLAALGLTHPWFARRNVHRAALAMLAVAALWSVSEARKFVRHGTEVTHSVDRSRRYLLPENNRLSKYSYEMWGRLPPHFSFGHMSPAMQVRLLDDSAQQTLESNGAYVLRHAPPPPANPPHRFVPNATGGTFVPALTLAPGESVQARFNFHETDPRGTLVVKGRRVHRVYELPSSGSESAFGAGPGQGKAITLVNYGHEPEEIEISFLRAAPPGVQTRFADLDVIPYNPAELPIRIDRMIPFELTVRVGQEKWLKTPKLLVPGYEAAIDGQPVPVARAPDGLLMLPVTPGRHQVSLRYTGPTVLRWAFWLNFTALAAAAAAILVQLAGPAWRGVRLRLPQPGPKLERLGGALAALAFAAGGWALYHHAQPPPPRALDPGHVRLTVQLPVGKHEVYEPLLTLTDHAGNTTTLVVFYENDRAIRIGCRKNGVLKILTDSLEASYFLPQDIDVLVGPLLRERDRGKFADLSDDAWAELGRKIQVRFNQTLAWETDLLHQSGPDFQYAIGSAAADRGANLQDFRGRFVEVAGLPKVSSGGGDPAAAAQQ